MKLFQSGYRYLWSAAGVSALAMLGLPAFAQDAETEAAEAMIMEEVIVTANRREETLQEYAGTIQAFTGSELEQMNVSDDFRTLQYAVTGLNISNQEGKIEVYLRGIGSSDSDFGSDPAVATLYNGIYLPRPRSIGPMFFDVERVEVAKGPQGTLRGRNAVGGTINIISKRPDFDEYYGQAKVGVGEYSYREAEAILNFGVTDSLAFRLAASWEERDPYMENAAADIIQDTGGLAGQGIRVQDSLNGNLDAPGAIDDTAIRLSMRWEPGDRFSAFVLADYVEQNGSSIPGAFSGRSIAAGYDIDNLDNPYRQYFVSQGRMDNEISGIAATLDYEFDSWTLEYNGSYREYDFQNWNAAREWQIGMDYPTAAEQFAAVVLGNEQSAYGAFNQSETSSTMINEIRAFANAGEKLQWTAGAFFMDEDFSWASQEISHGWWGDCDWFQPGTVCGWLNGLNGENRNDDSTVKSRAGYLDGVYSLTDRTRLIAGVRWTDDEKIANESNANYQLVFTDEALAALGLNGPEDIILGTNGYILTRAGDRPVNTVPLGNSADTRQYYLDGTVRFGNLDNVPDLIAYNPDLFQVIITSDFQTDLDGDGIPDPGSGNISSKYDDSYWDWRLGVEHDLNDAHMMYAKISTGTRSGGINRPLPGVSGNATTWDPEDLIVYELGLNSTFDLGGFPARANGAIFYYDYSDQVLQGLVEVDCTAPGDPTPCTVNHVQNQNAADSEVLGFEVDGDILFDYGFNLKWNVAYLDSEYKNGSIVVDPRQPPVEVDLGGNQMPFVSKWNAMLSLSQYIELDNGSIDWTLGATYRSKFYLTPFNSKGYDADGNEIPLDSAHMSGLVNNSWLIMGAGFPPANGNFMSDSVPSTLVWNFNIGFNAGEDEQFRLEGWYSNFTDETYSTKAFINNSVNIRFLNPPAMWGVRAIYRW